MSWLDKFRKKDPSELTPDRALAIVKERGYWEPNPGSKAATNPRLYFPHHDALAFAVDGDPTLPDDKRQVLVIFSAQDLEMFRDPAMLARAVDLGYASPRLKGKTFQVVDKPRG